MMEYRYNISTQQDTTRTVHSRNKGAGKINTPAHLAWLCATAREREIIETNAPFLKDCHGEYEGCEACAAALAFNFTEK